MADPILVVAGLALIILFGFLAGLFFRATRIPDILILMGAGIAIGPFGLGLIGPAELEPVLPPFTTLALLMILFSGGLGLPLGTVLRGAPVATVFTILVFAGCVGTVAYATQQLLDWPFQEGLMLGAVLGGTSSATVLGLLRGAPVTERGKTLLSLESTITDVLCITVLIGLITLQTDPGSGIQGGLARLGAQFGIGILAGAAGGFAWGELARRGKALRLEFMVTLAVVFLLYAGVEAVGGSGATAALVFGIVMASSRARGIVPKTAPLYARAVVRQMAEEETQQLRTFHDELTFLLRTMFFIVLGIRFPLVNPGPTVWMVLGAILLGWVVIRWAVAWPISLLGRLGRRDRFTTVHMFPRGMVAAVLATLPAQFTLPDGSPLLSAGRVEDYVLITFLLIGVTTVWASLAVLWAGRVKEAYEKPRNAQPL